MDVFEQCKALEDIVASLRVELKTERECVSLIAKERDSLLVRVKELECSLEGQIDWEEVSRRNREIVELRDQVKKLESRWNDYCGNVPLWIAKRAAESDSLRAKVTELEGRLEKAKEFGRHYHKTYYEKDAEKLFDMDWGREVFGISKSGG